MVGGTIIGSVGELVSELLGIEPSLNNQPATST